MKILRLLLITAVLIGLLGLPALWQPAEAQVTVTAPALEAASSTVYPTFNTVFTASGFAATTDVEVLFNGARIGRGNTDGSGVLTVTGQIPSVVSGTYSVQARMVANTSVVTNLNVTLAPTVTVKPTQLTPGAAIEVKALGFNAAELVTVTMSLTNTCQTTYTLGSKTTSTAGTALVNTTVPALAAGSYYVAAKGASSGCVNAP